jgi:hypothetical protein
MIAADIFIPIAFLIGCAVGWYNGYAAACRAHGWLRPHHWRRHGGHD